MIRATLPASMTLACSPPSPTPLELFEQLFEFAPDAILVIAPGGVMLRANAQCAVTFGYSRDELVGSTIELLVPDHVRGHHSALRDGYFDSPRERTMGAGLNLTGRHKDGSSIPVEIALRPLAGSAEPLVLTLVRDISERRLAERELLRAQNELELRVAERTRELSLANARLRGEVEERQTAERRLREEQAKLIQAEKLSSIGLLASGVAHEINNPLMGAMGCIKSLRDGSVAPERWGEYLETVQDGLARMHATVRGLLDYSRQQPPAYAAVDIIDICNAAIRLVEPIAQRMQIRIDCSGATSGPRTLADRGKLTQALVNVLVNAVQATPKDGTISIRCRNESTERFAIIISDSGPGIPETMLSRVCDPFFSTKPEGQGTGLGLAITLGILQAHEGDLEIRNLPEGGTEVTLMLPHATTAGAR